MVHSQLPYFIQSCIKSRGHSVCLSLKRTRWFYYSGPAQLNDSQWIGMDRKCLSYGGDGSTDGVEPGATARDTPNVIHCVAFVVYLLSYIHCEESTEGTERWQGAHSFRPSKYRRAFLSLAELSKTDLPSSSTCYQRLRISLFWLQTALQEAYAY